MCTFILSHAQSHWKLLGYLRQHIALPLLWPGCRLTNQTGTIVHSIILPLLRSLCGRKNNLAALPHPTCPWGTLKHLVEEGKGARSLHYKDQKAAISLFPLCGLFTQGRQCRVCWELSRGRDW